MRNFFTCTGKVKVYTRSPDLESDVHVTAVRINTNKTYSAFEILLVRIDRNITILIIQWNRETCTCYYIL